jgi:hypothetical protein
MPLGYGNSTHSLSLEAIEDVFKRPIEEHEFTQQGNKGNSSIKITSIYTNHEFEGCLGHNAVQR